jgi:hypothetical protein
VSKGRAPRTLLGVLYGAAAVSVMVSIVLVGDAHEYQTTGECRGCLLLPRINEHVPRTHAPPTAVKPTPDTIPQGPCADPAVLRLVPGRVPVYM